MRIITKHVVELQHSCNGIGFWGRETGLVLTARFAKGEMAYELQGHSVS